MRNGGMRYYLRSKVQCRLVKRKLLGGQEERSNRDELSLSGAENS